MFAFFDISGLIVNYGYVGIFSVVFLESGIFFPLPGDSLLFSAGLLASTGILSIFKVIPLIFIATLSGSLVGYQIGVHLNKLHKYYFFRKILKDEYIKKAHIFFEKYGKLTIIFCRFVPVVRTFAPIVAGVVKMNYLSFLKYNILGSFLWSTLITLTGYFLGKIIPQIENYISPVLGLIIVISFLPVIFEIFRRKKKAKIV